MISSKLKYGVVCLLSFVLFGGCVHEFPDEGATVPFTLNLSFDTALPLYTVVDAGSRSDAADYDIRYIVSVYPGAVGASKVDRTELYRFTFTKENVATLDHSLTMDILPGEYTFLVWSDYVRAGSVDDLFYNTSDFQEIKLQGEHKGNTDFRDAFRGEAVAEVGYSSEPVEVAMERPLAKYNFISTDLPEFITRVSALMEAREKKKAEEEQIADAYGYSLSNEGADDEDGVGSDGSKSDGGLTDEGTKGETRVNLDSFTVVFSYSGSMPSSFNMFTNQPADVSQGVEFSSKIKQIGETEAELGFDYIFVNGNESLSSVRITVYDEEGVEVSKTNPIEFPIVRSKLTTIRSTFLTSIASEGVTVKPDFDGDHPYVVP